MEDTGPDRWRRVALAGLAAVAVLAVVVGVALAVGLGGSDDGGRGTGPEVTGPGVTGPGVTGSGERETPPGSRLVGIGHLAVAVPVDWGRNETDCGTPQRDTVVIDQGAICLALVPRPRDVESVELLEGRPSGAGGDVTSVQVAGRQAERAAVHCRTQDFGPGVEVCHAWLHFPVEDVSFVAESSSPDARARVDQLLGRVLSVPELVAVPPFEGGNLGTQPGQGEVSPADQYVGEVREIGLSVEVRTEQRRMGSAGHVLAVEPRPGTMLELGSTVVVTVAG